MPDYDCDGIDDGPPQLSIWKKLLITVIVLGLAVAVYLFCIDYVFTDKPVKAIQNVMPGSRENPIHFVEERLEK